MRLNDVKLLKNHQTDLIIRESLDSKWEKSVQKPDVSVKKPLGSEKGDQGKSAEKMEFERGEQEHFRPSWWNCAVFGLNWHRKCWN